MASITVDSNGLDTVIKVVIPHIERQSLMDVLSKIPAAVADEYIKTHMQELMAGINPTEVYTAIAAAVAQKVVENMPKPEPAQTPKES